MKRTRNGHIIKSVIEQLSEILLALQTQKHTYETVVVDVIDDVIDMIKIAVCGEFDVKSLSEIGYGKGYDYFNQALTELVIDLKALPMNVIYISVKSLNTMTTEKQLRLYQVYVKNMSISSMETQT